MSARSTRSRHWKDSVEPDPEPSPDLKAVDPVALADLPEPDPWTHLVPLFPVTSFTPLAECPHKGPIPEGSSLVCMVCHAAGKDGHKAIPRDVKRLPDDPPPEPEPEPEAEGDETPSRPKPYVPSGLKGGIG